LPLGKDVDKDSTLLLKIAASDRWWESRMSRKLWNITFESQAEKIVSRIEFYTWCKHDITDESSNDSQPDCQMRQFQ